MTKAIFLDMDGVLVDAELLPLEYLRLMGDVLVPALGGTNEAWAGANRHVFLVLAQEFRDLTWPADPVASERRGYRLNVQRMCAYLGIAQPSDEDATRLGRAFNIYVRTNMTAVFEDAAPTIHRLSRGHELHLASGSPSGSPSWVVDPVLVGLGVADLFGLVCGADRIGERKPGAFGPPSAYYSRLFEAAHVEPREAVVVDDSEEALSAAKQVGATTVLVTGRGTGEAAVDLTIGGVGELPAALAVLQARG